MSPLLVALPPLLLAPLAAIPGARRWLPPLAVLAPLPALLLALAGDAAPVTTGWLLLGTTAGLDGTGRPFLLAASLLYGAAALHAWGYLRDDPRGARFLGFFLLAMAANLAMPLALDAAGLILAYALLGYATWGLVGHAGGEAAFAARVYVVFLVGSEALVLGALIAGSGLAGSTDLAEVAAAVADAPVVAALVVAGFGVKAGLLGLHLWLPPAHSIAPGPASAVLSGAMLKVAALAWLRLLPQAGFTLAQVLVALGVAGIFFGAGYGLGQTRPKAILAYSSVSQMGFVVAAAGLAVAGGAAQAAAVAFYALHHTLAKGGLFLGTSVALAGRHRAAALALLATLALAIAGAPLTGGALAKAALKDDAPFPLPLLFSLGAVASTLLLCRYLWVVARAPPQGAAPVTTWLGLCATALLAPLVPWLAASAATREKALAAGGLFDAAWPVVLGAAVAAAAVRFWPGGAAWRGWPLGDLLVPLAALGRLAFAGARRLAARVDEARCAATAGFSNAARRFTLDPQPAERWLGSWSTLGTAFAVLTLLLWLALLH